MVFFATMEKFEFFFGLQLSFSILRHTDNVSKALQKREMSASEGRQIAMANLETLESFLQEKEYDQFWDKVVSDSDSLGIENPKMPRKRKRPARYTNESLNEEVFLDVKLY